ncbi:MAG: hypothetical protein ACRDFS_09180 [Chloroflexota bacterium]
MVRDEDRDDLAASVAARRELGPGMEDYLIDEYVARIERRVEQRLTEKPAKARPEKDRSGMVPASLALSIPLIAIAGGMEGLAGIIVVMIGIVLVNVIHLAPSHRGG